MKILLVDNASKVLDQLNQLFKQNKCQTARVVDPIKALKLLQTHNFDVVIAADNLHQTSTFNLLKAISIKFSRLIRIAYLTDDSELASNIAHYLFRAPINNSALIEKLLYFKAQHQAITKQTIVNTVAKIKSLPSPPKVYLQLNAMLKNVNSDSEKMAKIIAQDPALTAKVLQITNNMFGRSQQTLTSISDAITKIGIDTLTTIVLTAELFCEQPKIANFSLSDAQQHSLQTAKFAATLVASEFKQQAMLAGLLHDIGKLLLFEIDPTLTAHYFEQNSRLSSDIALEQKVFATDHCQIGAYLLHLWSFPYDLIQAVLLHHSPKRLLSDNFSTAQAVYVANALLREQALDEDFIQHFQLTEQVETLKNAAQKHLLTL